MLDGRRVGRASPFEMTLYKSVGVAMEDAVAAALVMADAQRQSLGVVLPMS